MYGSAVRPHPADSARRALKRYHVRGIRLHLPDHIRLNDDAQAVAGPTSCKPLEVVRTRRSTGTVDSKGSGQAQGRPGLEQHPRRVAEARHHGRFAGTYLHHAGGRDRENDDDGRDEIASFRDRCARPVAAMRMRVPVMMMTVVMVAVNVSGAQESAPVGASTGKRLNLHGVAHVTGLGRDSRRRRGAQIDGRRAGRAADAVIDDDEIRLRQAFRQLAEIALAYERLAGVPKTFLFRIEGQSCGLGAGRVLACGGRRPHP